MSDHEPLPTGWQLRVVSVGLCCSLGYTAEAAACALRAGMDHFQESHFVAHNSQRIRVARLPDDDTWGAQRLSQWIVRSVDDCLGQVQELHDPELALLVLAPESSRPGIYEGHSMEAAVISADTLTVPLHEQSQVWQAGRAGLAVVLEQAKQLLATGVCRQVMVMGADSLLNAEAINHYLRADRLLVDENRDGFIPGEAAAAVLLELAPPEAPGLRIVGWGQGQEPGRWDGSVPSRSQGMTQAIRAAFDAAGVNCNDLDFRMSDQNGESFYARDAANAMTRVAEDGGTLPAVLTTADGVGEVGAATGPLMLAWLHHLLGRADAPGNCGLIHLSNDGGARSAVIVRYVQPPQEHTAHPLSSDPASNLHFRA